MHRHSLVFHTLGKYKNIELKKSLKYLGFFFGYSAQCLVTEVKYSHYFTMKCHFSFVFS